jgi:glutaconate CoA-transferase subunit B
LTGGGPSAVITDRGVIRFDPQKKEAVLVSFHPLSPTSTPDDAVAETGWPLRVSPDCEPTPAPTEEEVSILRMLDPEGFWLRKEQDR